MLWAVELLQRPERLRSTRQLRKLTERAAEFLRYGVVYFGGLDTFTFQCPGPCAQLQRIGPRPRRRVFNPRTQRFRCPICAIELQLSILAEVLPPHLTKRGARRYEASPLAEFAERPADTVPTANQAGAIRTYQIPFSRDDSVEEF
jgi:hypothetical protein